MLARIGFRWRFNRRNGYWLDFIKNIRRGQRTHRRTFDHSLTYHFPCLGIGTVFYYRRTHRRAFDRSPAHRVPL